MGTQVLMVVVVQATFEAAHTCPGGQAGVAHDSTLSGWHTIPSLQSESVVQGPGSHSLTIWGWQTGWTQSAPASPAGHATSGGHAEIPVI